MSEYLFCPIQDETFEPDTMEKCYLLFKRLADFTIEKYLDDDELADLEIQEDGSIDIHPKVKVWVIWEV